MFICNMIGMLDNVPKYLESRGKLVYKYNKCREFSRDVCNFDSLIFHGNFTATPEGRLKEG